MKLKSLWLIGLFLLGGLGLSAQSSETTLNLLLKGKEYEKMYLYLYRDHNGGAYAVGEKKDANRWVFNIPDSIYCDHSTMKFVVPGFTDVMFFDNLNDKEQYKKMINSFSLIKGSTTYVDARHVSSDTVQNDWSLGGRDRYIESFLLIHSTSKEFKAFRDIPRNYCKFNEGDYNKNLKRHIKTTRKYSDSQLASYFLYGNIYSFPEKEGIRQVFDCLSENNQNSYWGKKIQAYLDIKLFPNILLPVCGGDREERVIMDATKYNLVIFSASWCEPCRKLIPLLKEIYQDLKGDNLEFTYVSMDKTSTQKEWDKSLFENQIPWRSLMGGKQLDRIRDVYSTQAVPDAYLVSPNGEFERIDVRKQADKDKLYDLVKQGGNPSKE